MKILNNFPQNNPWSKNCSIVTPPYLQGYWVEQNWYYTGWECFHILVFHFSRKMFYEKIFKKIFPIHVYKNCPPPLWLNPTPRDHDFKQIWKDYLGMVPHNCQLYWQNRLWDLEKFYLKFSFVKIWTHPQLCPPPYSQGSWFQQIWIYTTWKKINIRLY